MTTTTTQADPVGNPRPARLLLSQPAGVDVPDRGTVTLRPASPADLDEVAAMHARCSPRSTYGRYLSAAPFPRPAGLGELLRTTVAVVAVAPGGAVVALGNLAHGDRDGTGELAVLVEDDWQGRGLGTAISRHLVAAARLLGLRHVEAVTLAEATWPTRTLRRLGSTTAEGLPFGEVTTRLALAPHHLGGLAAPAEGVTRVVETRSAAEAG